jgi:Mg-chelatase subunit ChlD
VFDTALTDVITVTHRIQATHVGGYSIGDDADIVVEDDTGQQITGHFEPQLLTVVPTCDNPHHSTLFLPLLHRPRCVPSRVPADVVILLDRSGSLGSRILEAAGGALDSFLDGLVLPRDRVGVVAFDQHAQLIVPLGSERARLRTAVEGVALAPGTRMEQAILLGLSELNGPRGRPGARRLLVLITDGVQTGQGGERAALVAGETARSRGVAILALGLGPSPDRQLLTRLAGSPSKVLLSPSRSTIPSGYRDLAALALCAGTAP